MIFAELLTLARKLNNYEVYGAGAGPLWTSTTNYKAVVPAGKRWFLYGGVVFRSASATASINVYDAADKKIYTLGSHAAATGICHYPEAENTGSLAFPIPLDAGEYVDITLGAAQGATAYGTCVVLEVDI